MAEIPFCQDFVTARLHYADLVARRLVSAPPRLVRAVGFVTRPAKLRNRRSGRLLRHADFERVYKQGRRHFSGLMTVFYLQRVPNAGSGNGGDLEVAGASSKIFGLRVGFTVGRALGGAVDRNRMKRRLREAVRLTRGERNFGADVVINPKKSLLTADFAAVLNEVERAFLVIEQKLKAGSVAAKNLREPNAANRKPN